MTFREAVDASSDLKGAWEAGLQALREADRQRLSPEETRRLRGSVYVEGRLETRYPSQRQWDYAIGFQPTNFTDEVVYWIEVHPANNREVKVVLEKLEALRKWLREQATELNRMRRSFIWVSSGKTTFTLTTAQRKRFTLLGLRHTGGFFQIPSKFAG